MGFVPCTPQEAEIRRYDMKAAEVWAIGAVVLLDANEELVEAGADPATILGFVQHASGVEPYPTKGYVALADDEKARFWLTGSSDGSAVATPAKANLNQSYGLAVDSDGIWYLDLSDTTNTRAYVHRIDLEQNRFEVSILAANRQAAP
ncbi:MAG: hypothetical protein GTO63_30260 [Anaerolineae bacterium]|nr:hypothetical protein [Anaerolineae bacterium]NIN98989.1 hypothetical protein [Anaerolineae bacterium]